MTGIAKYPHESGTPELVEIDRDDPRYDHLVNRGINGRFRGSPDRIHVVRSAAQIEQVIDRATQAGKRIGIRSGGHCFDGLVDDPAVRTLIDVSEMKNVYYDHTRQAFAVEAGATLGAMYRTLALGWGVTIPAGRCPGIGVGGHIMGGGGGALSRVHGLSVDYLYAVEVVVPDPVTGARTVIASRESDDPHRDLWWAHTGAGGGNFGVVTRYWFRSPTFADISPEALLPKPPRAVWKKTVRWEWDQLNVESFCTLVQNFGDWHARDSADRTRSTWLDNTLSLPRAGAGPITLETAVDADKPDAADLLADFIAAVDKGVGNIAETTSTVVPWLSEALAPDEYDGVVGRFKSKAAFLRSPWLPGQLENLYRHLTDPAYPGYAAAVYLTSHGGTINSVPTTGTAMAHRDAILKVYWSTFWFDQGEDDVHLRWIRGSYHEMFADAGGVPTPGDRYAGAFINYPDIDLADETINTSGTPWHQLYFRGNYPKLQAVKAKWDPADVFQHRLSIRLP